MQVVFAQIENAALPPIGVCTHLTQAPTLKKYGYDFIQPTVSDALMPEKSDSMFLAARGLALAVPITVINGFIPGHIKTTGPDVDEKMVMNYAKTVYERAHSLDIRTIVFGSGASRMIPDGFDREQAWGQFVSISKKLADLASDYNIVLALESQNKLECNFLNTVKDCIQMAKEVDHPNFKITIDSYHIFMEGETHQVIYDGAEYVHHCDLGEKEDRSAPGIHGDNFVPYFRAFQDIGFSGSIGLECRFTNLEQELPIAMETVVAQWELARRTSNELQKGF